MRKNIVNSKWAENMKKYEDEMKWGGTVQKKRVSMKFIILMAVMIIITILSVVFEEDIHGASSVFKQTVSSNASLNTMYHKIPCLIESIKIVTIAWIIIKIVRLVLRTSTKNSSRRSTIASLLSSCFKYIIAIAAILAILATWGADVGALVKGLGILALVIGLGAQSLIADIIAGIFSVFEGEFKVGDIVVIDGWKGMITEIGLRTTKIVSITGDVKIECNSQIASVVNLSERISGVPCELNVDYTEDIEKVENIINENLPGIKERIPKIHDIMYLGVCGLGVNYMSFLIVANCDQLYYEEVERALLRELKLMIDKNGIKKPMPTMYFNKDVTK
ncbi:MAG: mechanosensitive ion channel family protein [Clostridia bacterium]|nr:mechanosensitive ion channel family protein [Clostridia bacterium]